MNCIICGKEFIPQRKAVPMSVKRNYQKLKNEFLNMKKDNVKNVGLFLFPNEKISIFVAQNVDINTKKKIEDHVLMRLLVIIVGKNIQQAGIKQKKKIYAFVVKNVQINIEKSIHRK